MKYLFCLLLIGISQKSAAQSDTISALITRLKKTAITAAEKKALRAFAFDIQNRGQRLDESGQDYKKALQLTDSAIYLFKCLQDTLSEANNRKFKGYLLGRFGKYAEGKMEIRKAIQLFQLKQADWGVAVSQFDLSRLYEFQNKLDSALHYCNVAIAYWKRKGNLQRVFLDQNMLINLLTKTNEITRAQKVQFESQKISDSIKPQWQGLLDFYIVSENLYKATNEINAANNYHRLYSKLVEALKKSGIHANSYFNKK